MCAKRFVERAVIVVAKQISYGLIRTGSAGDEDLAVVLHSHRIKRVTEARGLDDDATGTKKEIGRASAEHAAQFKPLDEDVRRHFLGPRLQQHALANVAGIAGVDVFSRATEKLID